MASRNSIQGPPTSATEAHFAFATEEVTPNELPTKDVNMELTREASDGFDLPGFGNEMSDGLNEPSRCKNVVCDGIEAGFLELTQRKNPAKSGVLRVSNSGERSRTSTSNGYLILNQARLPFRHTAKCV